MSTLSKTARIVALLVVAGYGLLASGAGAETLWLHPDRDPFRGTLDDALSLFAAQGIPRQVLEEQRRLYVSGRCARRRIEDGERIDLMTFGQNRVLPAVVATTNLWPDWAPRGATVCFIPASSGSGYALLRPDVCGNWSEEKLPPQPAGSALIAPAATAVPGVSPGLRPDAPGVPDLASGSGEFSSPGGGVVPTVLPEVPEGELAPGLLAVLPSGLAENFPTPTGFVVPTVLPEIPEGELAPGSPDLPGPPVVPDFPGPPPAHVPEPASGLLLASALAGLGLVRRALRS